MIQSTSTILLSYVGSKSRSYISEFSPDIGYWTSHSRKTSDKNLKRAFKIEKPKDRYRYYYESYVEIKRICDTLQIGEKIFLEAMNIYKELFKLGFVRRIHMKFAILAACVMIATQIHKFPMSFKEIQEVSSENPKRIEKVYKKIRREMKIKILPLGLKDYILYYSNIFNLSPKEKIKALQLGNEVSTKINLSGKKLSGYCGAIIKYVTGMTYLKLEERINASGPTIQLRLREIKNVMKNGKKK